MDIAEEFQLLLDTNFFTDVPDGMTKSVYLYKIAKREADRFGSLDPLAARYFRLAAQARYRRM